MRFETAFASLLCVVFLAGCASTTTRTHPTLVSQLERIETVVIAPPRIEIQYLTLTGENERMLAKEAEIRERLVHSASEKLAAKGFSVIDFDFEKTIAEDEEFAYVVTQVREGFDQARLDLKMGKSIPESDARSIKTSVGEAVNIVAGKSGADAILLIRYAGFDKSDGYVAKDVGTSILVSVLTMGAVIPVQPASGAITEFALIDGVTGEVLWADTRAGSLGHSVGDKAMESMPTDSDPIEPLPPSDEPL